MIVKADLRDTRTGKCVQHTCKIEKEWEPGQFHQWTEGNYSCDCNRSLFMYGEEGELPCNNGKNVIVLDRLQVGDTVYGGADLEV